MPSFTRQPLLKPEVEEQLKQEMLKYWRGGTLAKDIANILDFGKVGSKYEKLKPCYVYYYRIKFGFQHRNKPPRKAGQSRYKHKQKDIMSFSEFKETLNEKVKPDTFEHRRQRAFDTLLFWSPLRSSEIYDRTIDDFEITETKLIIHLQRKKKKYKTPEEDEPLEIPLSLPMIDEVTAFIEGKEWKKKIIVGRRENGRRKRELSNRPFCISDTTAWTYIKDVFKNFYPHYYRFRFITHGLNKGVNVSQIKAATGLHLVTINEYLMAPTRLQSQVYEKIAEEETKK